MVWYDDQPKEHFAAPNAHATSLRYPSLVLVLTCGKAKSTWAEAFFFSLPSTAPSGVPRTCDAEKDEVRCKEARKDENRK